MMYLWTIWPPVCNPFEIVERRETKAERTTKERNQTDAV